MPQLLITRNDIAQYRQISTTWNDAKLNELILDAQMLDVAPLLGEKLYNKLVATPADYTELLDGGSYTVDGTDYNSYGLKAVIAYYTYARFVMLGDATATPFGFVQKLNSDVSQPVSDSMRKSTWQINKEAAAQIWDSVRNYLVRTKQPDYGFNHCQSAPRTGGFRIKKIG